MRNFLLLFLVLTLAGSPSFATDDKLHASKTAGAGSTGLMVFGADWVAAAVNALWGTSHTSATIREALATGLPP
ncbi:hypothetical protein F0U59_03190 [Archangium gephyra]|nr:hypothetical protein F0U59_03190 [Archangium gephyra]